MRIARRKEREKPPRASALRTRAVAGVRAAPGAALLGIDFQAPVDDDEARQGGLVRADGAADTAALGRRYEVCSTASSRASSTGTSTGAADSSAADAGIWSPAWWASA